MIDSSSAQVHATVLAIRAAGLAACSDSISPVAP
jgi:hypothetical protein